MDGTEQLLAYNGAPGVTANFREGGWNLGGVNTEGNPVDDTINSQAFWTTASGGRYGSAEFFTYDATNFRVRELSVGYSFPVSGSSAIKSARLSLIARNLFFLYRGSSECLSRDLESVRCLLIQTCRWVTVTGKVSLMVHYRQLVALVLTSSLHFKKNRTEYEKTYFHSEKNWQCCTFV